MLFLIVDLLFCTLHCCITPLFESPLCVLVTVVHYLVGSTTYHCGNPPVFFTPSHTIPSPMVCSQSLQLHPDFWTVIPPHRTAPLHAQHPYPQLAWSDAAAPPPLAQQGGILRPFLRFAFHPPTKGSASSRVTRASETESHTSAYSTMGDDALPAGTSISERSSSDSASSRSGGSGRASGAGGSGLPSSASAASSSALAGSPLQWSSPVGAASIGSFCLRFQALSIHALPFGAATAQRMTSPATTAAADGTPATLPGTPGDYSGNTSADMQGGNSLVGGNHTSGSPTHSRLFAAAEVSDSGAGSLSVQLRSHDEEAVPYRVVNVLPGSNVALSQKVRGLACSLPPSVYARLHSLFHQSASCLCSSEEKIHLNLP